MSMKLVCDHCEGVIVDAEFREERRSVMSRNPNDATAGTARVSEETFHYHALCFDIRVKAADNAPMTSAADPEAEISDDHPLKRADQEAATQRDESIRTGEATTRELAFQKRREELDEMTLESLRDLASEHDISGRSKMDKKELIEALLAVGA
jgi:hypothetical protein